MRIESFVSQINLEENYADNSTNNKKKFQTELEEFIKTKEKLIGNFFELSETQISGDAIRNWLYENSKN